MKRFYTEVARVSHDDGFAIHLDRRAVMTPARAHLVVAGSALADAIVAEWSSQGDDIDPATMPMTGLANATIDRVLPAVGSFAAGIAAYAVTDLFCYRATDPAALAERQAAAWDRPLAWARARFDITFVITDGVMPVDQPVATVERLGAAVVALDPWLLAGLSVMTTLTGSLVGTLGFVEGAMMADELWDAAHVDDRWQEEQWGADAEAAARLKIRRGEFDNAVRYCALVRAA